MPNQTYYYEVALPLKLKENLIYISQKKWPAGACVWVRVKSRLLSAVILRAVPPPGAGFALKPVLSEDKTKTPLSPARLKWLMWMASYYHHSPGLVVGMSFPPLKPKKNQKTKPVIPAKAGIHTPDKDSKKTGNISLFSQTEHSQKEKNFNLSQIQEVKRILNREQSHCVKNIQVKEGFKVHLIEGVTGSGKTEVFFSLMEPVLKMGKSVLVLVPEIALTPQHIKRFSLRFKGQVACFHSEMTPRQKTNVWEEVLRGQKRILIGPRSVLFCPLPRLGLIIVDEEHEAVFKQEEKLKYHGRDGAVYLGRCLKIPVVLASATPSLESLQNVWCGKYQHHRLTKRFFKACVPVTEVVDMREEIKTPHRPYWLSESLYQALNQCLKNREQAALFLNRRGEKAYVFCRACGFHFSCLNCDIALTQHQKTHLVCHYCGFREEKPSTCPSCGFKELSSFGLGTQVLEQELKSLFPRVRVVRADRDEIKNHKEWEHLVEEMEAGRVDILVGTQMIAKGLDFENLSLVGMVLADPVLNRPDFRSSERSFQLFQQMAGRAGRRTKQGRVLLQTYSPSHPVIQSLKKGDYESFAKKELHHRKKYSYPPFTKLVLIKLSSIKNEVALKAALQVKKILNSPENIKVLGPAPSPLFRIQNRYRYDILLKSSSTLALSGAIQKINKAWSVKAGAARLHINVDPVSMF